MTAPTLTPTTTPKVTPRLAPTPMQIPVVRTYMVGDFMRAFGFPEEVIRTIQDGVASGYIQAVVVKGKDYRGEVTAATTFSLSELTNPGTVMVDTSSATSVTEQMSRRFAQSILFCVDQMKRRGLAVKYGYQLSPLGQANKGEAYSTLDLHDSDDRYANGIRQVFRITHAPTGSTLTHQST